MAAFIIAEIVITDPEKYETYRTQTAASFEPHGGKILVRGGPAELLEGDQLPGRMVVIEFPDIAKLNAWYGSETYQALKAIRVAAAESRFISVDTASS
jgi:uncharacterized protein (DUF1330 family)